MNKLKIVHCANFSYFKNGEVFYATDRKVTHGLMSQGHFVYDFSYRDQAKAQRFLGFKKKNKSHFKNINLLCCVKQFLIWLFL